MKTWEEYSSKLEDHEVKAERSRVRKDVFKAKHRDGFKKSDQLADWWIAKLVSQQGCCDYCKTPVRLLRDLIDQGLLKGRSTRGEGVRGRFLELEKIQPEAGYIPENCTLVCYYCNNDKSNVYSREDYIRYLAPAKAEHFKMLSEKLSKRVAA